MGRAIVLIGETFGRLVVMRRVGVDHKGSTMWLCRCSVDLGGCGAEHSASCDNLRAGKVRSCGCLKRAAIGMRARKHGAAGVRKTGEYETWRHMRRRCHVASDKAYPNYGGRGIAVCDRWRNDFIAFLADMGPKPSPQHSIDRINNDGHYEPGNCRWATDTEQARNSRKNVIVEHDGAHACIAEWAAIAGISYTAMRKRINRGWPMEKALSKPLRVTQRP